MNQSEEAMIGSASYILICQFFLILRVYSEIINCSVLDFHRVQRLKHASSGPDESRISSSPQFSLDLCGDHQCFLHQTSVLSIRRLSDQVQYESCGTSLCCSGRCSSSVSLRSSMFKPSCLFFSLVNLFNGYSSDNCEPLKQKYDDDTLHSLLIGFFSLSISTIGHGFPWRKHA